MKIFNLNKAENYLNHSLQLFNFQFNLCFKTYLILISILVGFIYTSSVSRRVLYYEQSKNYLYQIIFFYLRKTFLLLSIYQNIIIPTDFRLFQLFMVDILTFCLYYKYILENFSFYLTI